MMFVWWSSGQNGPKIGCCGGLLFLPFAFFTMSAGAGSDTFWFLLLGVTVLTALFFVLPRLTSAPVDAKQKRKNDAYDDGVDDEKPKRDAERYILTDDGEILDITDAPDADSRRRDNRLF